MTGLTFGHPLSHFTNKNKTAVTVRQVTGPSAFSAYIYKCPLNVDWDGAPKAYGLDRPGVQGQTGLDPWELPKRRGSLANARNHANWDEEWVGLLAVTEAEAKRILRQYGLIPPAPAKGPDVLSHASRQILAKFRDNRPHTAYGHSLENLAGDGRFPVVQIAEMPTTMAEGYYVSTTAWSDTSKEAWDPHRYLDASAVPYSVVPALPGVALGDYGLIIRNINGYATPYVCGDSSGSKGGSRKLGECSGAIYLAMGRENEGEFSFIVFPGSRNGSRLNDPTAAVSPVRRQLIKLSAEDANDLAGHLTSNTHFWWCIRWALTRWGAPPPALFRSDELDLIRGIPGQDPLRLSATEAVA